MLSVLIIPEGIASSDGRSFDPGSLTWRETVPLMFLDETSDGHHGAEFVGTITNLRRQTVDGETWIVGDLAYDRESTPAVNAERLAVEQKVSGVSADVAVVFEEVEDEDGLLGLELASAEIVGATQLPMPAFGQARILATTLDAPVLTAAALPDQWNPPRELFEVAEPDEPTPITLYLADGWVGFYGHAARDWSQCHLSFTDCITPPISPSNGGEFNTRRLVTAEGTPLTVGLVTMGTDPKGGHADLMAAPAPTIEHYDNANSAIAAGRMTNGLIAPWICGAILPDVTEEQLLRFQLQQLSGDWRTVDGALEMVACLAVPLGGFGVKARVASGHIMAMIATGPPPGEPPQPVSDTQLVAAALELVYSEMKALRTAITPIEATLETLNDSPASEAETAGVLAKVFADT